MIQLFDAGSCWLKTGTIYKLKFVRKIPPTPHVKTGYSPVRVLGCAVSTFMCACVCATFASHPASVIKHFRAAAVPAVDRALWRRRRRRRRWRTRHLAVVDVLVGAVVHGRVSVIGQRAPTFGVEPAVALAHPLVRLDRVVLAFAVVGAVVAVVRLAAVADAHLEAEDQRLRYYYGRAAS